MNETQTAEIIKVWAGVHGYNALRKMLNGDLSIKQYLNNVIQECQKSIDDTEKELEAEKSDKDPNRFIISRLESTITDNKRMVAFAQGYLSNQSNCENKSSQALGGAEKKTAQEATQA